MRCTMAKSKSSEGSSHVPHEDSIRDERDVPKLNQRQALREAQEVWGEDARVYDRGSNTHPRERYAIGHTETGDEADVEIVGSGKTWEWALSEAYHRNWCDRWLIERQKRFPDRE